jgi:hypothetical protein
LIKFGLKLNGFIFGGKTPSILPILNPQFLSKNHHPEEIIIMINPAARYGEMIALSCRNHPNLRWHTKNIDYIGARSIFFNLFNNPDMGKECSCPSSLLTLAPEEDCSKL